MCVQAEAERVRDQLQHIQWSLPQGGVINLESSLVGEFLHTALSVVGAVRHKDASVRRTVNLRLPPCTQLSTVHVSQLRRAVGEVSCMTFSVDTLTQVSSCIANISAAAHILDTHLNDRAFLQGTPGHVMSVMHHRNALLHARNA